MVDLFEIQLWTLIKIGLCILLLSKLKDNELLDTRQNVATYLIAANSSNWNGFHAMWMKAVEYYKLRFAKVIIWAIGFIAEMRNTQI